MKKLLIIIFLFTITLSAFSQKLIDSTSANKSVDKSINKNTRILVDNTDIFELFGPVLPIAFSPFFGVALTSLASILASEGIFENEFLATHPILSNYGFFILFLVLTILTALPKYTKITGQFGLFISKLEDYAGVIILISIQVLPSLFKDMQTTETVVYQAGMFEFTYTSLISIVAVANLYVIRVVRYFFDFLIFVSPVPAIDAFFDNSKKGFVALIIALYAFSPLLAFILNVIIFIISLFLFVWLKRRVTYFEYIYVNPLKARIFNKLPELVALRIPKKIRGKHSYLDFALKVFPMNKINKFKRKMLCWLICENGKLYLYKNRFFRKPLTLKIHKIPEQLQIGKDIFWFRIQEQTKRLNLKLDISNEYKQYYEEITNFANLQNINNIGAKALMQKTKEAIKNKSIQLYNRITRKKLMN